MFKVLVIPAAVGVLVLAALAVILGLGGIRTDEAAASPGSVSLLAVDMDITGNSIDAATDSDADTTLDTEATSVGTIEDCAQIATDGTTQVDIVVTGYPADDPLVAYDVTLNYDPAVVNVTGTALDTFYGDLGGSLPTLRTLISADPQSGPFFAVDENGDPITLPDTDGAFSIQNLDLAPLDPDEDVDGEEVSDGFLARIQLTGVGAGQTTLSLTTSTFFVISDGGQVPVDTINWGFLSVDGACVPGAQPTPTPTPTPTTTPTPTPTPTSTSTPTPTPTPTIPTPTPAGTASPSPAGTTTPTPTGTPASGPAAGPPTGDGIAVDEGDSRSVLPWLFVGLGAALTVVATGYATYSARGDLASGVRRSRRRLFPHK